MTYVRDMNDPRKHHTVPASYLKRFTCNPQKGRDSQIYVYDHIKKEVRFQKVGEVSHARDFYATLNLDGTKNYDYEKYFFQKVDDIPAVIDKIVRQEMLSLDEISSLSYFMVIQELRSKSRRKFDNSSDNDLLRVALSQILGNVHTRNEQEKSLHLFLKEHFHTSLLKYEVSDIFDKVIAGEEIELHGSNESIESIVHMGEKLHTILIHRPRFILTIGSNKGFVTSDYPLTLHGDHRGIYGVGYGTAEIITFPVTRHHLIAIFRPDYLNLPIDQSYLKEKKYQYLQNHKTIRRFNYWTCFATDREIYSHSKELLLSIVQKIDKRDEEYKKKIRL